MPWIRTIDPDAADGRLAEAYQWQARKLGRPTEFTQLGSLDAELVHARLVMYRASENVPSRLSVRQRQLISYLTSILNETPHCAALARTQIRSLSDGDDLLASLDAQDYAALPAPDAALAHYVHTLTLQPGQVATSHLDALRTAGFDDLDILDANNQCAHLNYTNRVANGLGLLTEPAVEERTLNRVPS